MNFNLTIETKDGQRNITMIDRCLEQVTAMAEGAYLALNMVDKSDSVFITITNRPL